MTDTALSDAVAELDFFGGLGPHSQQDIHRYYASGDWQSRVLYDFVEAQARDYPDRTFVTDGGGRLTYADLRERAVRLATGLAGLGVARGDRVAVQMPNWTEFAVTTVALSRLGAVLVPIMPIFRHEEVRYIVDHAGATLLIGPESFHKFDYRAMYAEVRAQLPALRAVVIARSADPAALSDEGVFESLFAAGDVEELDAALGEHAGADDPALIVYTSGTTSFPKGCLHTFNTMYASSVAMIRRLRIGPDDVFFNPSPVAHSTGLITGLVMPIIAGAGTHFQPEWDPAEGLRRIQEYRCTITYTATTFLATALAAYDKADGAFDVSSMRYWVCAGAPIPGAVVQAGHARFTGCSILSLYGRSENFTTTMCSPDDSPERSVTSDGRPLEGTQVRLVDREGEEVSRGEEGDIVYKGPAHMVGYYRNVEETRKLYTPSGFSRSGDLGYMNEDGYVRVSGRLKDIIIRGGLNISSREVEDLLSGHPAIAAVAVVAMPDKRLGEKCCAYVVLAEGVETLTLQEVVGYLREKKVATQKLPERLEVVASFPMTPVGKIRKNVLRDMIAEALRAEESAQARPV